MLKYYRCTYDGESFAKTEITFEKALEIVLGTYKDNDMTRDMLTIPNRIRCRFSEISVEDCTDEHNHKVLMAGMYNALPIDTYYDEDGNRIAEA